MWIYVCSLMSNVEYSCEIIVWYGLNEYVDLLWQNIPLIPLKTDIANAIYSGLADYKRHPVSTASIDPPQYVCSTILGG